MARSAGITVSAVVVFIGSAFTILFGAVMVAGSLFMPNSSRLPNVPGNFGYVLIAEAVFFFAFGVWGIAAGVGLVNTRQWARISISRRRWSWPSFDFPLRVIRICRKTLRR